jgi:hypothetical protein
MENERVSIHMNDFTELTDQFLEAVRKLSAESFRCEISAVLNEMPLALANKGPKFDGALIEKVDELIDRLYQDERLFFPAHRWLSGPKPESRRGRLISSFDYGSLFRSSDLSNRWAWRGGTTYFCMPEFESFSSDPE